MTDLIETYAVAIRADPELATKEALTKLAQDMQAGKVRAAREKLRAVLNVIKEKNQAETKSVINAIITDQITKQFADYDIRQETDGTISLTPKAPTQISLGDK